MTARDHPETFPFIAVGGGTTTLIFAADSGRRWFKHRRSRESNKPQS